MPQLPGDSSELLYILFGRATFLFNFTDLGFHLLGLGFLFESSPQLL